MEYIRMSWKRVVTDCIALSQKIGNKNIDEIVAISRGGVVIGRLLSDYLSLPLMTIAMRSYSGVTKVHEPLLKQAITGDYTNKTLLLVDDVSDTGKTFGKGKSYLQALQAKKIYTAAAYIKPQTKYIPDFWVQSVSDWIIFPYEIHEIYTLFVKEQGRKKAKETLLNLGVEEWEIGG